MQNSGARKYGQEHSEDTSRRDYYRDYARRSRQERMPEQEEPRQSRKQNPKQKPRPKQKKLSNRPRYKKVYNGDKNMPSVLQRGNTIFIVETERHQYKLPRNLTLSIVLGMLCFLAIVLTNAQIAETEREISRSSTQLNLLHEQNRGIEARISSHYTLEEIEYYAIVRLGMTFPDPSQVIEIDVPRQSHVAFNRSENIMPRENYFWLDLRSFVSGVLDNLFGGS